MTGQITGLIIAGSILGYLAAGMGMGRYVFTSLLADSPRHATDRDKDEPTRGYRESLQWMWAALIFWPLFLVFGVMVQIGYGIFWIITRPPTKHERLKKRAKELERDKEQLREDERALSAWADEHGKPRPWGVVE